MQTLLDAAVPTASIIALAQALVRIPSQAGIDQCTDVLGAIEGWLSEHGVVPVRLKSKAGKPVAILAELGSKEVPVYCLNACVDTAPFGDLATWHSNPASGDIIDGWLYGRGSADCKIAVAMFAHLAVEFAPLQAEMSCGLSVLFDADEHTGQFGGIQRYVAVQPRLAGVMIGYPGNQGVVVGARGFCRLHLTVFATATHSGSVKPGRINAVAKAARLVACLSEVELPHESDPDFPFGPRLSVTGIRGGNGYSVTPDQCEIHVDVRLTPSFSSEAAVELVGRISRELDLRHPTRKSTFLEITETWPAYKLPEASPLVSALRSAASTLTARDVPTVVCGPSNVGNYLASLGIQATCGYGVTYKNIHAPDEGVDLSTVEMVYRVYREAIIAISGSHDGARKR